jgi:hypothetical protein
MKIEIPYIKTYGRVSVTQTLLFFLYAGERWGAGEAPLKADAPTRVRPCGVDLWDREVFRQRVRKIARKAKEKRHSPPRIGDEEDDHLLPEIRDLKRRSLEILVARMQMGSKENKVISNPNPGYTQSLADPVCISTPPHVTGWRS